VNKVPLRAGANSFRLSPPKGTRTGSMMRPTADSTTPTLRSVPVGHFSPSECFRCGQESEAWVALLPGPECDVEFGVYCVACADELGAFAAPKLHRHRDRLLVACR
jgi:hypothetical protein